LELAADTAKLEHDGPDLVLAQQLGYGDLQR
jgi:hypothetical protein